MSLRQRSRLVFRHRDAAADPVAVAKAVRPAVPSPPLPGNHDDYTRHILDAIDAGRPVSQRSLSRELGVALGLTNLLIHRLVNRGFVRVLNIRPNRVRYLITPRGIVEKARVTRAFLENTVRLYTHTREQIRANLVALSASWPGHGSGGSFASAQSVGGPPEPWRRRSDPAPGTFHANNAGEKRIVFYGAGEVAEIGYISLQTTDLRLVGVVDDHLRTPFFGFPVRTPEDVRRSRSPSVDMTLDAEPFSRVVIMSFRQTEQMSAKLRGLGLSRDQICVLRASPRRRLQMAPDGPSSPPAREGGRAQGEGGD